MNKFLTLVVCALEVARIGAYNVDTSLYRVMKGPKDNSYFGYSLASARINGSLTFWSGSPKLGPTHGTTGGAKEGGIYHCEVVQTTSNLLQQNCRLMNFKTPNPNRKENNTEGTEEEEDTTFTGESLPKCSFEDDICNFTVDKYHFWVDKKTYLSREMLLSKSSTKQKKKKGCYPFIKGGKRLTGPPKYSINEGILVLDSDKAVENIENGEQVTTSLSTPTIEARSKKTQCLRFCFNAFSLFDYNVTDETSKSADWYKPSKSTRTRAKPQRSLRVYLQYEGTRSTREIFLYQGPKDIASKNWNFTEIDLEHDEDSGYKIYFEATIVNNAEKRICSTASDIALSDITVSNSACHAEQDQVDTLDGEQSIGMTLDVKITDNKTSTITTCGPLWQQNCGFAKEATGVCYEVRSNSTQPRVLKNPGLKGCIRGKMDIVLLVDQSGSVNQCNFQKVKHWLRNVVRGFAIGPNEQDIGIVIYSSPDTTRDVFQLGFEKYANSGKEKKRIMLEGLLKLPYEAGKTYTGLAFKRANNMLWGPGARKEAKKMIILLTDGDTSKPDKTNLQTQTQLSRSRNATILTVGVAKFNKSELISISGDKKNFFSAKDFSELEKIRDTLRFTVSHSNLEGSRRSKSMQNCQMGFSIHRGKNELLMGAPGCFDRAGDVMRSVRSANKNDLIDDDIVENLNETGTKRTTISPTFSSSNLTLKAKISPAQTLEVPTLEDLEEAMQNMLVESYFGYAVTSGEFFGKTEGSYVAASAPRYDRKGAVLVYKSSPPKLVANSTLLSGIQFGEYFGAVLCAEDLNNDDFTDLFVGAPLHNDVSPDEGRVYVYMGGKHLSGKPDVVLKGSGLPFSRFGLVISPVGDVTLDGYKEIVVSAPQEDDGKGAIYIFCGGEGKVTAEYTQRIAASSFSDHHSLKMFGQSVSGLDVDGNQYPDILVGTPGSDAIVVLRTRPVAHINVQFHIETPAIDRRNKMCWAKNITSDKSCIRCKVCFSYSGESVPAGIKIRYAIQSDIFQSISRVAFKEATDQRKTIQQVVGLWHPNVLTCSEYILYLKKNIPDMMTNLTLELTYDMNDYSSNDAANLRSELSPILEAKSKKTHYASTFFKTYCEDTASCVADISVTESGPVSEEGSSIQSYFLSYERILRFRLVIYNDGPEEAHAVLITIRYPSSLVFSSISENECLKPLTQTVDSSNTDGVSSVSMVLFKTFLGVNETCSGRLNFLTKPILPQSRPDSVTFIVNASTVSRDYYLPDNVETYEVMLEYETAFTIAGRSYPETLSGYFINTTDSSQVAASSFSHLYTIVNTGAFVIENVSVSIKWPTCTIGQTETYYAQYIKATFWRGRQTETNRSSLARISDDILLSNDSSICDDHQYSGSGDTQVDFSDCPSVVTKCPIISIFIDKISSNQQINFHVVGAIDVSQFKDTQEPVSLVSHIHVDILDKTDLKYSENQIFHLMLGTTFFPPHEVDTAKGEKKFTDLPWWVYVVSCVVGVLLLMAVMWLLRWCGFFESKYAKKKKDAEEDGGPESVPLND